MIPSYRSYLFDMEQTVEQLLLEIRNVLDNAALQEHGRIPKLPTIDSNCETVQ